MYEFDFFSAASFSHDFSIVLNLFAFLKLKLFIFNYSKRN